MPALFSECIWNATKFIMPLHATGLDIRKDRMLCVDIIFHPGLLT